MNPFESYRVTSPYGWRTSPINNTREFHTGIDLVKSHEAPIYAFTPGEVIHAKEGVTGSGFGGYGIVVAIRCLKTGHVHCYAHLHSTIVKVGDIVSRGKMIGRQGNTGQSTGSHLHYEIRKKSTPSYGWISDKANMCFDPTKYLQDLYTKEEEERKVKESSSAMKLVQYQWEMLEEAIPKLSLANEEEWLEKVKKRKLTLDELTWINTIVLSRRLTPSA